MRSPPHWSFPGQGGNQLAHLPAQPRPSATRAGLPAPEESPPTPVPPDDRLRPHEDEVPAPAAPEPSSHHPDEPVARAQPEALPSRAGEDGESVPQQEVFGHQLAVTAETRVEKSGEEEQMVEHRPGRMLPIRSKRRTRFLHPHRHVTAGGINLSLAGFAGDRRGAPGRLCSPRPLSGARPRARRPGARRRSPAPQPPRPYGPAGVGRPHAPSSGRSRRPTRCALHRRAQGRLAPAAQYGSRRRRGRTQRRATTAPAPSAASSAREGSAPLHYGRRFRAAER